MYDLKNSQMGLMADWNTPGHLIIKLVKTKDTEKALKAVRLKKDTLFTET